MHWINTLENLEIPKSDVYDWEMKFRPNSIDNGADDDNDTL
jgi:hypothetical protein